MLADPRHSSIVLLNMTRIRDGRSSVDPNRGGGSLALLSAATEIFGIPQIAVGEYERGAFPDRIDSFIERLDVDALSVWRDPQLAARLTASGAGMIFLGGAFLEEEVLMAALEGTRHGYDIRLLLDVSVARHEADRPLVLTRLAHHGILATTVRQALLEWAVSLGDQAVSRRVQGLLS